MKISMRKIVAVFALASTTQPALACGDQPFIGEVCFFPYNFCPMNFAPTDGKTYSINSYQALFSLLGTTYGGDGVKTFGVPDMRGRTAVGAGSGPSLTPMVNGQMAGTESATLTTSNLPQGTAIVSSTGTTAPATSGSNPAYVAMSSGAGIPVSTRSPYVAMTACIALTGIFPQRP